MKPQQIDTIAIPENMARDYIGDMAQSLAGVADKAHLDEVAMLLRLVTQMVSAD